MTKRRSKPKPPSSENELERLRRFVRRVRSFYFEQVEGELVAVNPARLDPAQRWVRGSWFEFESRALAPAPPPKATGGVDAR